MKIEPLEITYTTTTHDRIDDLTNKLNTVIEELNRREEVGKSEWPTKDAVYWFVDDVCGVWETTWVGTPKEQERRHANNIFRTEAEAMAARDEIKKLLLMLKK